MGLVILSYQNFLTSTGTLQQLRELSACVFHLEPSKWQFGILSSFWVNLFIWIMVNHFPLLSIILLSKCEIRDQREAPTLENGIVLHSGTNFHLRYTGSNF